MNTSCYVAYSLRYEVRGNNMELTLNSGKSDGYNAGSLKTIASLACWRVRSVPCAILGWTSIRCTSKELSSKSESDPEGCSQRCRTYVCLHIATSYVVANASIWCSLIWATCLPYHKDPVVGFLSCFVSHRRPRKKNEAESKSTEEYVAICPRFALSMNS